MEGRIARRNNEMAASANAPSLYSVLLVWETSEGVREALGWACDAWRRFGREIRGSGETNAAMVDVQNSCSNSVSATGRDYGLENGRGAIRYIEIPAGVLQRSKANLHDEEFLRSTD